VGWGYGVQQYISYIMATSFSGGRSRSTRREPPTMDKQLVHPVLDSVISDKKTFIHFPI
jgi:hypothetical protein